MNGRRVSTPHRRAAFLAGGLLALAGVVGPWSVRPAAAASGVDMTLPKGHSIAGHVTGPGGTPIAGIGLEADGDNGSGQGISAADGSFTIQGLRDGTYQVLLLPERRSIYLPHWYGAPTSSRDPDGATNITISGADVAGIDQQLEVGADLSGTVTGVPGSPVTDLLVSARGEIDSNSAFVHADGTYQVVGLFPDTYTLAVITPTNSPYTAGVVQDGAVIEQDFGGTPYDATSGDVTGADFSVSKGVTISGHITGGEGPVQIDALDASGGDGSGATVTDAKVTTRSAGCGRRCTRSSSHAERPGRPLRQWLLPVRCLRRRRARRPELGRTGGCNRWGHHPAVDRDPGRRRHVRDDPSRNGP